MIDMDLDKLKSLPAERLVAMVKEQRIRVERLKTRGVARASSERLLRLVEETLRSLKAGS